MTVDCNLRSPSCNQWLTHGSGATNPSMLNTPSVAINFFPQSLAAINCFSRSIINCSTFRGFKQIHYQILISSKICLYMYKRFIT